jgi:preprotein translocase subunit SecG
MEFVYSLVLTVQVLAALGIIGLVLMQHGKGADMGASFGSGASGSLFGATGSANFLSRSTAVLATVFFICTLGLAFLAKSRVIAAPESVMDKLGTPPASTAPGAALPTPADPKAAPANPAATNPTAPNPGASNPSVPPASGATVVPPASGVTPGAPAASGAATPAAVPPATVVAPPVSTPPAAAPSSAPPAPAK